MADGGALVDFTHAVAIFVIGGVFDRTGPEIVLSEGSPCISAFASETGAQHFQR
jgi:hypothetical protein